MVKKVVGRVPPLTVATLTFSVAALSLVPALLSEWPVADTTGWLLLVYLGVVPTDKLVHAFLFALFGLLWMRAARTRGLVKWVICGELVVPKVLFTAMNWQGVLSLWSIRRPGRDGRLDAWNQSALEAVLLAMNHGFASVPTWPCGPTRSTKPLRSRTSPSGPP